MNNDTNSGRSIEKHKKSKQKANKGPNKWTFCRSLLFLLITFDLIAVLAWLIYYHSYYEDISKIVGGVWTAVLTFLTRIRENSQIKIFNLNQMLKGIQNVNKTINNEKDPDSLLNDICNALIENSGYRSIWISLWNSNGKLLSWAEAGLSDVFPKFL